MTAALPIPIGGIGPHRARCLDRLRHPSQLTTFSERETPGNGAEDARISDAGGGQRA
jgi:hypothetical protein